MVITGVAGSRADWIRRLVYLNAFIPATASMMGLSARAARISSRHEQGRLHRPEMGRRQRATAARRAQSSKTITDAIVLKNPAARALDATYILTWNKHASRERRVLSAVVGANANAAGAGP